LLHVCDGDPVDDFPSGAGALERGVLDPWREVVFEQWPPDNLELVFKCTNEVASGTVVPELTGQLGRLEGEEMLSLPSGHPREQRVPVQLWASVFEDNDPDGQLCAIPVVWKSQLSAVLEVHHELSNLGALLPLGLELLGLPSGSEVPLEQQRGLEHLCSGDGLLLFDLAKVALWLAC
jgi:hypothetical protein